MPSAMKFFPHYLNAQRDVKIIKLKRAHKMEGYGVYWALLEMIYESPKRAVECDYETIASLLDCDERLLKSVVENFGLFEIDENKGVFYSEAAQRYTDEYDAKNNSRSEKCRQAALKMWAKKRSVKNSANLSVRDVQEDACKNTQQEINELPNVSKRSLNEPNSFEEVNTEYYPPEPDVVPLDDVIQIWNEIFSGTKQEYRGFHLSAVCHQRARETLDAGYTIGDLRQAFEVARKDDFAWTLKAAIKVDNVQLLLTKGEKQNGTRNDETEISATRESNVFGVDWSQFERGHEQ